MILRSAALLALLLSAPVALAKGDAKAGEAKSTVCQACHGTDGNGTGDGQYPRIAGQYADYLVAQLKAFKDGVRMNDPNGMMRAVAERMSEREIRAVAEYAAGLR